ncbi:MAG: helix-turn-helix domain-containing protein, partial [Pseudonocardiales bacterium]|nr:helix-turn-helix domain-containing protein [Pseudonocardiales bacterium]
MTDPDSRLTRLRPIPDPASPPGQLAHALRELAREAGFENLRQLADRAHVGLGPVSEALSGKWQALSGKRHLVPSKEVVDAICDACNADQPPRVRLQELRD